MPHRIIKEKSTETIQRDFRNLWSRFSHMWHLVAHSVGFGNVLRIRVDDFEKFVEARKIRRDEDK